MIFDFTVIYAYFFGSLLIVLFTLLRYSAGTDKYGTIMRLINAIKVVDLRTKTPDSFPMHWFSFLVDRNRVRDYS